MYLHENSRWPRSKKQKNAFGARGCPVQYYNYFTVLQPVVARVLRISLDSWIWT
jgi:hypothetical protein